MPFELSVPQVSPPPLSFSADSGQIVFVLGANGTGKLSTKRTWILRQDYLKKMRP
jgi:ABC-type Na+ transport system ATPase subunit NatA